MTSTAPTHLIVSADDLGLSECVNRGIMEGVEAGVITSASVMACGRAFEHAVSLAHDHPGLDLGVHLCLDEELPLLSQAEIPSLVGTDGRFLSRGVLLRKLLMSRDLDLEEVRREFSAQIERCLDSGIELSHFNGHGHVHVYPYISDVVVQLARRYGVRACRLPSEPLGYAGRDFRPQAYLNKMIVAAFSRLSRGKFRAAGICIPDLFYGMVYGGRLSPDRVAHLLAELPPGRTVELMSHPGRFDAQELSDYAHWDYDWEADLAGLKSLAGSFEARRGIVSISFRELVQMSNQSDDMGSYWDKVVLEWEQTSYTEGEVSHHGESPGMVEKLAGTLRAHIPERQKSCLRFLDDKVSDQVCVELGCATGSSCFALLEMGARKVIGLDISGRAVASASAEAERRGLDPARIEFHQFACGDELPFSESVDLALGLGIAEYIEPSVFHDYLEQVNARDFFFSFDEKRVNLQKALHFVYRNIKQIPYYKMYTQPEIRDLLAGVSPGRLTTFREGQNAFVTSLSRTDG